MKIVIRFKSGFELAVTCEKFKFTKHSMTEEIMSYDIEGIKDNNPVFFRSGDVECIYQIMDERGEANDTEAQILHQSHQMVV